MKKRKYNLVDREAGKVMESRKITEKEAQGHNSGFRIMSGDLEYVEVPK